jgi:cold-inducible RNA-binding protein
MQNKLFIGNLAYSAETDELREMFSKHGAVLEVAIPSDRMTGRPRGFAFVTMDTSEAAQNALVLDGTEIGGRKISVTIAHNKKNG